MKNDPRKQVPCPWDPNATCPESPKQSINFGDYGEFIIIRWNKNGKRGERVITSPDAVDYIRLKIFGLVLDSYVQENVSDDEDRC